MPNKFTNQLDFGGANISAVPDSIPDIDASDCDSIDFSLDGVMSVNSGKVSLAAEIAGLTGAPTDYSMYLFKKVFGTQKEVLVRLGRVSGNGRLQWFTGTKFEILSTSTFGANMGFANGNGDGSAKINRLFMGDGTNDMMFWNGATTSLVSVTSNTITAATDLLGEGFELNAYGVANTILINGVSFTYTGISGANFTGVSPDPTSSFGSTIFAGDGIVNPPDTRLMKQCLVQSYKIQYNAVGLNGNNITRTDASIDFSTAGFQLGQKVFVTGFTDTDNNRVWTVKTVTNTTITFADGEVGGATEAAGNYITVSAGAPKGNILQTDNGKLYIAGILGDENTVFYSVTNQMTNFAITTDAKLTDGGFATILPGGGGITALFPRGNNRIIVHKKDGIFSYNLSLNSSNIVEPTMDILALGSGVGAVNNRCIASYDKSIYYFNGVGEMKSMEQSVYNTSTFNFDTIAGQLKNLKISGTPYLVYDFKKSRLVLSCNIERIGFESSRAYNYLISVFIKRTPQGNVYKTSFDWVPLTSTGLNVVSVMPIVYTTKDFTTVSGTRVMANINKLLVNLCITNNVYIWGGNRSNTTNSKPFWISGERTFLEPAQDKEFDIINFDGFLYGDTQIRFTILYGFNGSQNVKTFVLDKNTLNENGEKVVDANTLSQYNYNILGGNSIFNDYDFSLFADAKHFSFPMHIDASKTDRYRVRIETNNSDLNNTWWAINNMSVNATLKDVDMKKMVNSNEEDGYGIGSMIVGSTNIVG